MNYDEIWEDCLRYKIQQKKSEFVELLTEIGTSENILEIGSYDGGSSIGFCNIAKNVTSINLNYHSNYTQLKSEKSNWSFIQGDSHSTEIYNQIKNKKFDFIFIDGDHTEHGVETDFQLYSILASNNCKVAFHDIIDNEEHRKQNCFVANFWNRIKNNYKHNELIHEPYTWGGIGILYL